MSDNYNFFTDWSRRLRRPLAGLSFNRERASGRSMIVARHYPHLLCWSWFLEQLDECNTNSGTHHDGGIHLRRHNYGGYLVIGRWWLHWQNYRMPALRR